MSTFPPFLKPGDTIAITCPAGYMAKEKAATCIRVLGEWGYQVEIGRTLGSRSKNYFSGTDRERLREFQEFLDDDKINAILCARGGYGVGRIIEDINFSKFRRKPKWIIGFSDITVLHSHINSNFNIVTLHAPMAAAFNDGGYKDKYVKSLKDCLEGKKTKYECRPHRLNNTGTARGKMVGGNLCLLAHTIGTSSEINTKDKILFLEDLGEYQYNLDRMFYQLKRSGKFEKLAGLIIGKFTDTKDTERPFGKKVYEMIHDILKEYDFPICYNFPVSHTKENYALKSGAHYQLKVGKSRVVVVDEGK